MIDDGQKFLYSDAAVLNFQGRDARRQMWVIRDGTERDSLMNARDDLGMIHSEEQHLQEGATTANVLPQIRSLLKGRFEPAQSIVDRLPTSDLIARHASETHNVVKGNESQCPEEPYRERELTIISSVISRLDAMTALLTGQTGVSMFLMETQPERRLERTKNVSYVA